MKGTWTFTLYLKQVTQQKKTKKQLATQQQNTTQQKRKTKMLFPNLRILSVLVRFEIHTDGSIQPHKPARLRLQALQK